ncbi:deoxyribodipyrimidine photo-lyase [Streptomyces sp. NPDC012474]|uniref:deoxyribodipyrimidine photo-lyase n=1 Tax=Streptomyces sp. NPDC012474 TaxID=3364836 RepID=UPI0036F08AB7
MTVAVVLFTSDLRLHDHPPLRAALNPADEAVPPFVRDATGSDVTDRAAFLAGLDASLRRRGGRLVVRTGPVARVAGTGTRPHRVLNPVLQGRRYDPDGTYVRRRVPEPADVGGAAVHEPWRLPADEPRQRCPAPLIDLGEGPARFRQARGHG